MDENERYVLGRLIGEGATACVYEAEDTVLQREVAVKVYRDIDIGGSTGERIDEEARILARLAHPHLLPVYDSGRGTDDRRFIVMPLVRGTTLAKLLAAGPVAPSEVKRIGRALSGALAYIHAQGIVHRDVKPSNVLLAEDGTPYLADFGFARAVDGPALTATDCIVGTAGYLAPEQAEGLPLTSAVDVYALGLVLLEALTGEREYHGTPLERATANALRPPRIPARLGPGWLKVLRSMTVRTPSERPLAEEVRALMDLGEDELPAGTAFDGTMELLSVPVASAVPVPVPTPVSSVAASSSAETVGAVGAVGAVNAAGAVHAAGVSGVSGVAGAGSRRNRRLAALGAAAFTAIAVAGVGTDWVIGGASADTTSPSSTVPGAGAVGQQQNQVPAMAPAAAPTTVPTTSTSTTTVTTTVASTTAPPTTTSPPPPAGNVNVNKPVTQNQPPGQTKCQPGDGGQKGNGHGKHKC